MGRFNEAIKSAILVFDGSMGALVGQMGYATNCTDELAVTHPDVIKGIHEKYIEAGANVILADTFGATEMSLAHKGKKGRGAEFTKAAVSLAKEAAGNRALVAVDMGPTSEFMAPVGMYKADDFIKTFFDQASSAKEAGADFAMVETQTDLAEARCALLGAKKAGLEAAVSFTFENGKTLTGSSPECCAIVMERLGASAIGINCSTGPDEMLPVVRKLTSFTHLPVIVQPNAGLPKTAPDGKLYYPFSPEEMLESMKPIVVAGASAVGGCCGTTPEHIRLISALAGGAPAPRTENTEKYVCSLRVFAPLSEAIEATANIEDPEDMYDLEEEDLLAVIDLTEMDAEEAEEFTSDCAAFGKTPLAFKADNEETLEAALRTYSGVACVFAGSDLQDVCDKYGAYRVEE